MNFKEAYEEMLKGKKVRRKNWEDYKYYTLNENDIYFVGKLIVSNIAVKDVLAEDWEIVEESKVWKPKEKELYFYYDSEGLIYESVYSGGSIDKNRLDLGNCFRTREQAKHMVEKLKVINELKNFAAENNEKEIDWKNDNQEKHIITYAVNYEYKNIIFSYSSIAKYLPFNIYFTSKEITQKAIETIGEDRIKKYYFDVED